VQSVGYRRRRVCLPGARHGRHLGDDHDWRLRREVHGGVSGGVEGNWNLVGVQTLGVVVTCVWTCIGTAMLCVIAQAIHPIRSTEQDEHKGLDTRVHLKRNSSRRSNGCPQEVNDSGDSSTDAEEEDSYVSMPGAANA